MVILSVDVEQEWKSRSMNVHSLDILSWVETFARKPHFRH